MKPLIKISQKLIDRLLQKKSSFTGKLYGMSLHNDLYIMELECDLKEQDTLYLINALPAEIYLCGMIQAKIGACNEEVMKPRLTDIYVTDNPVFIHYDIMKSIMEVSVFVNGQMERTHFVSFCDQDIFDKCLYVYLSSNINLACGCSEIGIKESMTNLQKHVASGNVAFKLQDEDIYLLRSDNTNGGVIGINSDTTIFKFFCDLTNHGEGTAKKKGQAVEVITLFMLNKVLQHAEDDCKGHAPICILEKKLDKTVKISIPIGGLAIVQKKLELADLYPILVECVIRNLRLMEYVLLNRQKTMVEQLSQAEIIHFIPQGCSQFITQIYFQEDTEEGLLPSRKWLHDMLLLNYDTPRFRRNNQYKFNTNIHVDEPLINPHIGLKCSENSGRIVLVKGRYAYYHYNQNKMDDNGWGCAYRSLQTLASWFKFQGYTNKEVPSFEDIQKCLVDIGDKPSSFIGSHQWIGSTEVNYVLNSYLDITSKIIYISSGEEMASKGPELVNHFETQGSPIMIGGGVLAHTILGVDYNIKTGNIKFLILDPHYTGPEDVRVVQNKGWCGWKGIEFWEKTAYYNMCLPQVLKCI